MRHSDIRNLVVSDSPSAALFQPGRIGNMRLRQPLRAGTDFHPIL